MTVPPTQVTTVCATGVALMIGFAAHADAPYPPSERITGIEFDFSSHRRLAPGSDNWPVTWADDDRLYTTWGDGGGFGGTNSDGRVSNGFARVEGSPGAYTGTNLAGGKGAPKPAPFTGKSYGIVCVDGVLYTWRSGDASGETAYRFQELWRSDDHGATWSATPVRFEPRRFDPPRDRGFFVPTFLQLGKDYSGARDDYVYTYAPDIKTTRWAMHKPGEITLLRAARTRLTEPAAYEFFAGIGDDGAPRWTAEPKQRRPVWRDERSGVMRISAGLCPGPDRYLLVAEHTRRAQGNIGIYEAPEPWGPWRTVYFAREWGKGHIEVSSFFWCFCPKWWREGGRKFTLVFTGTGSNDSWNTLDGRLRVGSEGG